jgi:hypothetical protein
LRGKSYWDTLLAQNHLLPQDCFTILIHSDTQKLLQLWAKRTWLFELSSDNSFTYCWFSRRAECKSHGDFRPDFRGRPEKPGNVCLSEYLQAVPERTIHKAVRVKLQCIPGF